ncbi:hypothetical protein SEPCBS57363_001356 [Sporothrix epigloea]|uniref:Uncharacterized protein n=1 Tax=Sporothrix epigloea TaxID=1892477 RepID=A0ABP0D9U5_9PEZI
MKCTVCLVGLAGTALGSSLATDINVISRYWGELAPYADNAEDYFGVNDVGVPQGCGLEQAHLLQRHAQRFDTDWGDESLMGSNFAAKVAAVKQPNFSGPLAFLNSYEYLMSESYLTGIGASTEFGLGVNFWNRYGRLLYNATAGQVAFNATSPAALDASSKPVLRTTSNSRMWNSQISWALGFFGPSFRPTKDIDPTLSNWTAPFRAIVIPEGGTENNTLASYDSCANDNIEPMIDMGDVKMKPYVEKYLVAAARRMRAYVPPGFNITATDAYAMQSLCAYETAAFGESAFCSLFTLDEWAGFEVTHDAQYYYDYSYGNPTSRAQGIGYVQELIARLTNQYITVSNTSVNSTLTNNAEDFPLGAKFYADFTHDDIIVSVLTAMSIDYLHDAPSLSQWPPNPNRNFVLSSLTPFGGHLVAEVFGCKSAAPEAVTAHTTVYSKKSTGYDAAKASHKFVRLRLNNGILPLNTIRGGHCAGRTDGFCAIKDFLASQANSTALANYEYACTGNYTIKHPDDNKDWDGTIFA